MRVKTLEHAADIAVRHSADNFVTPEGHKRKIDMTTVGTGKYRYEFIQDFPKLPAGQSFGIVSTVATDSQTLPLAFHDCWSRKSASETG